MLKNIQGSKNFMTPDMIETHTAKGFNTYIEFAEGTGINGEEIFGVSCFEWRVKDSNYGKTDKGELFDDKDKARLYFNKLVKEFK